MRIPDALAIASQSNLEEKLEEAGLEFCVFSGNIENPDRWPEVGWLEGSVDDLAACIELAALSENRIVRGMYILEEGIEQAAERLRDACIDAPDTLEAIARELHQKDGVQTSRMAMAIVANALTFHMAISGSHGIETLDQLRGVNGLPSKSRIDPESLETHSHKHQLLADLHDRLRHPPSDPQRVGPGNPGEALWRGSRSSYARRD